MAKIRVGLRGPGVVMVQQTMLLLDSGRLDLEWLITRRMSLGRVDEALDLLTGDAGKALLVPGQR